MAPDGHDPEPEVPAQIGRYLVLGVAATGDMGPVLRAYDRRLRREVALEWLRAADDAARVVREAQALARLSHPNLAAIYDADLHDGQPFVAMELVEGETLREWLATPRPWRETLAIAIAAGQGLAAAHAAGIIHRDVQPAHVIVGKDGRVRVTDCGIASGTPPYVAPEVASGGVADARSDAFAFCVTLWEALYGKRPFAGDAAAMQQAKLKHQLPAVVDRGVPAWLHRALVRGLSPAPADRQVDMNALLAELRRDLERTRMLQRGGLAAVAVASIAAIVGAQKLVENSRIADCEAAGTEIYSTWNEEARSGLVHAMRQSGATDPEALARRTAAWLDAFAIRWADARTQVCLGGEVTLTLTPDAYAGTRWCLQDRALAVESLLGELARGDQPAAYRSISAAANLPTPASCRGAVAPPLELPRNAVREVRAAISRAGALAWSGDPAAGLTVAHEAVDEAERLGWMPLVAAARLEVCTLEKFVGHLDLAHAACEATYFEAAAAGLHDLAAEAAIQLVSVAGSDLGRLEEGRQWALHAEVALGHLADHGAARRHRLLANRGEMLHRAGRYADARVAHQEALALAEQSLGAEHPEIVGLLDDLAIVLDALGDRDAAVAMRERARALAERALGPDHPDVGAVGVIGQAPPR